MKNAIHATTAVRSSKSTLRAINDFYIIEEDPIELTVDKSSGLNKDVVEALRSKKLVLPEIAEHYADKYPFTGRVVSKGDQTKYAEIKVGTHVMFARLGGMRWEENGKQMMNLREKDIHAIIP